jgi:hypothetical protein
MRMVKFGRSGETVVREKWRGRWGSGRGGMGMGKG